MGRQQALKKVRKETPLLRLDLGCGDRAQDGFTGVDIWSGPNVTVVHDLFKFPWPFKDASVSEVYASHFFEHVPGRLRGKWMNELWRVLVPGRSENGQPVEGFARIIVPYYASMRAAQDYTHEWPPICDASFLYFNKGWREANKLSHYDATCDFDYSWGYAIGNQWATRPDESRAFAIPHYLNVVDDLHVTLVKKG